MSSNFPVAGTLLYGWAFLCLAFMSGLHPLALSLLPVAAVAYWFRERWPLSKRNAGIGAGAALALTVVVWQTAEDSGYLLGVGSLSFAVFAAATLMAFTLLRSTEETRLAIPGLCGILLVACSMSVKIKFVIVVGLVGTMLLALALRERQGLVLSFRQAPPLLVMFCLAMVMATGAKWSETRLAYLLNLFSVIPASGIRFPPTATLNSLQQSHFSDVVVLRVYGDVAPPYLVGRSFVDYDDKSFWHWRPTKEEVYPSGTVASPANDGVSLQVYPNIKGSEPDLSSPVMVEFPDGGSGFTFYTPRYFSALATDLPRLHRYGDGLWQVLARDEFSGLYCLYPNAEGWVNPGPPEVLSQEERAKHLALSPGLTPEVARLAQEVAGAYPDPEEKARRITTFFQTKFEYGYDFPFESPKTALEEFLLKRPAAHCEFFATSTALMLRAQGVPTRYINGFVVQERSFDNTYFVIRLKHAHAWVEAYLPGQGWTTFDPTPPGVLDKPETQNSTFRGMLEWISNRWRQLISWFRMPPTDMLESVKRFLTSRSPGQWLAAIALLAGVWGLRRWRRWRRRGRPSLKTDAPFRAGRHERLTPLLETLQGAVHPPEWRRQAWETPAQWADRLAASRLDPEVLLRTRAALERYGAARYGAVSDEAEAARLESELVALRRAFEGKSLEARERPSP
jgi:transglutaminase-like putative cysteine protease